MKELSHRQREKTVNHDKQVVGFNWIMGPMNFCHRVYAILGAWHSIMYSFIL